MPSAELTVCKCDMPGSAPIVALDVHKRTYKRITTDTMKPPWVAAHYLKEHMPLMCKEVCSCRLELDTDNGVGCLLT